MTISPTSEDAYPRYPSFTGAQSPFNLSTIAESRGLGEWNTASRNPPEIKLSTSSFNRSISLSADSSQASQPQPGK